MRLSFAPRAAISLSRRSFVSSSLVMASCSVAGGKLDLESELGRGTVATVRLPASRLLANERQATLGDIRAAG